MSIAINIRISKSLKERLSKAAALSSRTESELIRQGIDIICREYERREEEMSEKTVFVKVGKCNTCGKKLIAAVKKIMFLDENPPHEWQDRIQVSAHCGNPGHNMHTVYVTREQFDRAENNSVI